MVQRQYATRKLLTDERNRFVIDYLANFNIHFQRVDTNENLLPVGIAKRSTASFGGE